MVKNNVVSLHQPPGEAADTMPVRILSLKLICKPPVLAVVDALVGRALEIDGIMIMRSPGNLWISMPAKPQIGRDDKVVRDSAGKVKYIPTMKWTDRIIADRFKNSLLNAVAAQYGPDVFHVGEDR